MCVGLTNYTQQWTPVLFNWTFDFVGTEFRSVELLRIWPISILERIAQEAVDPSTGR